MKIVESEFWKEAMRSCHFVVEDPLTEHSPEGHLPVFNPQGPTSAVTPEGNSPANNPKSNI